MASLSDFCLFMSVLFGFCLGGISVYVGGTMLFPYGEKYQAWKYGFNHVFGDYFNCMRQSNTCKRLFQVVVGLFQFVSGLLLCLGVITTYTVKLTYEKFECYNFIIASTSVILLTMDLTAYTVRRSLMVCEHNKEDLYLLCAVALATGTVFCRFYRIPYSALSFEHKHDFMCVSIFCIIVFCVSLFCRCTTRASISEIRVALAQFDDFFIHKNHGNLNEKVNFDYEKNARPEE